MNGQAWSTAEQFDPMDATTAEHDFGNLIDFDHLDLDFNIGTYSQGPQSDSQQLADLADSLDVHQLQNNFSPQVGQHHNDGAQGGQQQHQQQSSMGGHAMSQSANGFGFDYSMIPYSQAGTSSFSQSQDSLFRPHQGVPPTPNSVEMHGDPHRYMQQMDTQHAIFDQRYHMRKDDAVCLVPVTPVNPANLVVVIYPTRIPSCDPP